MEELMGDKRFCYVHNGVYHAKRAFTVHSVLNWCLRQRNLGKMNEAETLRYFKILNMYLNDEVEIKWQNGKIITNSKKFS